MHWISGVLSRDEIGIIKDTIETGHFIDGKATAGYRAKQVKNNLQLQKTDDQTKALNTLIIDALKRNKLFQTVALPKRIHRPLISRYTAGMHYGRHTDDALMDKPNALRTDIAVTVFLNDPNDYAGGELIIETALGEQMVKLESGDAIVYPASTLHRVAPVTDGERLVAVTWVQSYIRDPYQREILFDLSRVRQYFDKQTPACNETDLTHKVYSNLLRLWAEV